MTLPKLGKLIKVPLREVWNNEASIFTPWLELPENLEILSEALGLPALQPHAREHTIGRYSGDLVCAIGDTNEFLLIENQIVISDHRHLDQLMTYVSGLNAQDMPIRYVAWLAEDFRDEHRDAIEWLNSQLDEKLGFFACRIEAWRIGDSERAPRFDVIVEPRQLVRMASASPRSPDAQGIDIHRVAYWGAFSDEVRKRARPFEPRSEPPRMGVYSFTLRSDLGVCLYASRNVSAESISAYVSFASAPAPIPRIVFEKLEADRATIEQQFGIQLQWRELVPDKNYRAQVEPVAADPLVESDWPRQHRWLVDQIEKLYTIFEPRIRDLPQRDALLASTTTLTE